MLGIPSFRYMSKEKLASFVSALPDVDPDVAKKALEQFPDLSAAITEIVGHYRGIVSECLAGSDADTRLCLVTCASIIDSIQHELESEALTFEQRETLIGQSLELVQIMRYISMKLTPNTIIPRTKTLSTFPESVIALPVRTSATASMRARTIARRISPDPAFAAYSLMKRGRLRQNHIRAHNPTTPPNN